MIGKRGKEMNKIVWNNLIIMNSVKKDAVRIKKFLHPLLRLFYYVQQVVWEISHMQRRCRKLKFCS